MKTLRLPATFAFAALVAAAPSLAMADCVAGMKHTTASNCAAGQSWDAESQSCTTPVSG